LPGKYALEVSSPGVERPIRKRRDFERYVGREISVRGFGPLAEGSRKVRGVLLGVEGTGDDERIRLRLEGDREVEILRSDIARAQLVYRW
jgi:ribosome maturation factor RimP